MPANRREPDVGALAPAPRRRPVLVSAAVAATSAIALGLLRPAGRFR